jgi:hypothetical protein
MINSLTDLSKREEIGNILKRAIEVHKKAGGLCWFSLFGRLMERGIK